MKERIVAIQCAGKGFDGKPVLPETIPVLIQIRHGRGGQANTSVEPTGCPYNTGSHGERCKAAHPRQDKVGEGVLCPFSFDFPHIQKVVPDWQLPPELARVASWYNCLKHIASTSKQG